MAHFIVEYTSNLAAETDIPALLRKANEALIAQSVYPIGGVRSRAIELADWCMADGVEDYAFVHGTLKIGAGRSREVRQRTGDALFEVNGSTVLPQIWGRLLLCAGAIGVFAMLGLWLQRRCRPRG